MATTSKVVDPIIPINVLSLPGEVLDNILSYLSYDAVSHVRLVCKRFDESAQRVLNQGFHKVGKFHAQCVRKLKELLPRRESERRKHLLSGHCDILTAIESRLSLLDMTFMRHIDLQHCCFIPGKVLDEIFRVLRLVSAMQVPTRSYELLQELRDISSMAMEHFDDKIVPTFRGKKSVARRSALNEVFSGRFLDSKPYINTFKTQTFSPQVNKMHTMYRRLLNKYMKLEREDLKHRRKVVEYRRKINNINRTLSEQNISLLQQTTQINIQEAKLDEIGKKVDEYQEYVSAIVSQHKEQCMAYRPHFHCNCVNNPSPNDANNPENDPSNSESSSSKRSSSSKNSPRKRIKKH